MKLPVPPHIHFINYEKAFNSVDRETLWILHHYDVAGKLGRVIWNAYKVMTCKIVCGGKLMEVFRVRTRVCQGCLLSPFLFLLAIDWIIKIATGRRNEIQCTPWTQLDDLNFADNLAVLSHTHQQMQEKADHVVVTSAQLAGTSTGEKPRS